MNVQLIISCSSKLLAFGSFGDFDAFLLELHGTILLLALNYYAISHLNDSIVTVGF